MRDAFEELLGCVHVDAAFVLPLRSSVVSARKRPTFVEFLHRRGERLRFSLSTFSPLSRRVNIPDEFLDSAHTHTQSASVRLVFLSPKGENSQLTILFHCLENESESEKHT